MQRVACHTLGCKLNFSESSTIIRQLEDKGYERCAFSDEADVYIINTCSVTEQADKECRQLIRKVKRLNPASRVVLTGCYAQLKSEQLAAMEGVDLVIGADEKFNLHQHLENLYTDSMEKICGGDLERIHTFHAASSGHERTRAFLKVQDGCDYTCTFCTIPLARGYSRSDSLNGVLGNARELEEAGVQEIVLTGVNLGDFGKGYEGAEKKEDDFFSLMQLLEEETAIPRYRISSIEPNLMRDEMIHWLAGSRRFMPHLHMPLQSGNNEVLGLMRRRYRRELYADKVRLIKSLMPHACIGVDVIVGFPGESDQAFEDTRAFLASLDISYLHVFTYSERDHTPAIQLPAKVPVEKRRERNAVLRALSDEKIQHFYQQHEGDVRPVLFEQAEKDGFMEGYSDNYIKVSIPYQADYVNRIIHYRLHL